MYLRVSTLCYLGPNTRSTVHHLECKWNAILFVPSHRFKAPTTNRKDSYAGTMPSRERRKLEPKWHQPAFLPKWYSRFLRTQQYFPQKQRADTSWRPFLQDDLRRLSDYFLDLVKGSKRSSFFLTGAASDRPSPRQLVLPRPVARECPRLPLGFEAEAHRQYVTRCDSVRIPWQVMRWWRRHGCHVHQHGLKKQECPQTAPRSAR